MSGSASREPLTAQSRPDSHVVAISRKNGPKLKELPMNIRQSDLLSRRTFLRGVGVSMALPWLESLPAWADPVPPALAEPPVRLAVLFAGNGFHSREWWARGQGRDMELGRVLTPLQPFREKLTFIRGLRNPQG